MEHPFVFRLFTEMGDHPLNRDYYTIAHRRLRRWFDELPSIYDACRPTIERELGPREIEDDDSDDGSGNPQDVDEEQERLHQWDEDYRERMEELLAEYEADPIGFARDYFQPGVFVRPPPAIIYRTSCAIIAAALVMRADDLNETQYELGREEIVAAAREGPDLHPRGGLAPWAAGIVSIAQAVFPDIRLPRPQ
jgi:hypothetical protein